MTEKINNERFSENFGYQNLSFLKKYLCKSSEDKKSANGQST